MAIFNSYVSLPEGTIIGSESPANSWIYCTTSVRNHRTFCWFGAPMNQGGSSCISPQLALKSLNINSDSSSIPYIPWNLNLFSWLSLGPGPLGFVARRQDHQDVFSTMLASSVAWKNHRTWEPETFKIKGQKGKTRFCCLVKIYIYM